MDNDVLLREYHKRGVYLHRKNRQAVRAFAEDLIADSSSSVDFTVQVCTVIDDWLGDVTTQTFHPTLCAIATDFILSPCLCYK